MATTTQQAQGNERTWDWRTVATILSICGMLLSLGITWGTQRAAIAESRQRVDENRVRIERVEECLVTIQVTLARIESDVQHIRERLDAAQR